MSISTNWESSSYDDFEDLDLFLLEKEYSAKPYIKTIDVQLTDGRSFSYEMKKTLNNFYRYVTK